MSTSIKRSIRHVYVYVQSSINLSRKLRCDKSAHNLWYYVYDNNKLNVCVTQPMSTDSWRTQLVEMSLPFVFPVVCFGTRQFSEDNKWFEQFDFWHFQIIHHCMLISTGPYCLYDSGFPFLFLKIVLHLTFIILFVML